MIAPRRDRYVSWALGAIAGISVGISILDVIGIAPGWAAKLTPFFVGILLLYVVLERERVDSVKYIVRRLDRGIDKLRSEIRKTKAARGRASGDKYRSILWKGMVFRSNTEVRVAKALDHAGVFFLPPTKSRLNVGKTRQSREIDFLVFYNGQWGMLEVDGPWHTANNDEARDELLRVSGIDPRRIYRFDSDRCYHNAAGVVAEFLANLKRLAPTIQTLSSTDA
jgi:hypothetical protein